MSTLTLTEEIVEETRAALPADTPATWTLADLVRVGSVAVTQDFAGFGAGRQACAQSAAGLGYQALFG